MILNYVILTLFFFFFLIGRPNPFMVEKWVDHSLDMARKAEKGQKAAEKA